MIDPRLLSLRSLRNDLTLNFLCHDEVSTAPSGLDIGFYAENGFGIVHFRSPPDTARLPRRRLPEECFVDTGWAVQIIHVQKANLGKMVITEIRAAEDTEGSRWIEGIDPEVPQTHLVQLLKRGVHREI
jgi:hypothetical protein